MITISLCMIVKNEEDVIANCLESVKDIVDEMIIVDTGSDDKTKKLLKDIQIKFMILNGLMIFLPQEILLLVKLPKIIFFG